MRDCPLCAGRGRVPEVRPNNVLPFPARDIPPERWSEPRLIAAFREAFPFLREGDVFEFRDGGAT